MKLYVVHAFASSIHRKLQVPSRPVCRSREGECIPRRSTKSTTPENAPVVGRWTTWPSSSHDNPDADTNEDTLPSEALTSNTDCTGRWYWNREQDQTFGKKICITSTFTYTGLDKCTAFNLVCIHERFWSRMTDVKSTAWTLSCDWCDVEVTHLV
jgi:hypothetical protein